jgi:hypothetical protein
MRAVHGGSLDLSKRGPENLPAGSTLGKLPRDLTEPLRLQYALRQRARDLGWEEADVKVVDVDLCPSGAAAADRRRGFKDLTEFALFEE